MKALRWGLVLVCAQAWAADWQFLGASDVGAYYADRHSLQWQGSSPIFHIATNVIEKDKVEWQTVIRIDCGNSTFTYLSGAKMEGGKATLRFDTPRSTEKILTGTMPDLLKTEYCGTFPAAERNIVRWEPAGKSNVANVYFNRESYRQHKDGFVIDTKVVPFSHEEETYGTVSFSCKDDTFTMLKLDRLKGGRLEKVFDKPQPPLKTGRMATLEIVADKFCGESKTASAASAKDACIRVLSQMRSLESKIQQDADDGSLACSQVEDYLSQIADIGKSTEKHDCGITGLDAYAQQVRSAACVK
jgi:hypothetical protein